MTKRVLVTGASRGIGRAIALVLAKAGFEVVLNYKSNRAKAEATLSQIKAGNGVAGLLPFDVSDREATAAAIEQEVAAFRSLHLTFKLPEDELLGFHAGPGIFKPIFNASEGYLDVLDAS